MILTDKNCKVLLGEFIELHKSCVCLDIGISGLLVYIIKHTSVQCIEFYVITNMEWMSLYLGAAPVNYLEYACLSLDDIIRLINQ